jgi:hypothetical protein
MTHYDVTSSNVAKLGYDSDTETVEVQFKDAAGEVTSTWHYSPVSRADFELIRTAPSVGRAVRQYLVKGPYQSKKVS